MKLYNTLTKTIDTLSPIVPGIASLYSCGPTVYDVPHIGNWRAMIVADTLHRVLSLNYKVDHVMNITDVDDKTIKLAGETHSTGAPKQNLRTYTDAIYLQVAQEAAQLGIDLSTYRVKRAADDRHIEDMQQLITQILDNKLGYVSDGSVYFDIAAYQKAGHTYGVLGNVDFRPQERVDNDEYDKHEARDFVLWKATTDGEASWDFTHNSQILPGRPGWHIECSAMAVDDTRQQVDIHTGGVDLIFPHHENEIAQTCAAQGVQLAKIFIHNEHLHIDDTKMSKSLKNDYKLSDITEMGISPKALRLQYLQAHYRSQQNFSTTSLQAAQNALLNLYAWADLHFQGLTQDTEFETFRDSFEASLNDDLNTPGALSTLNRYIDECASRHTAPGLETLKYIDSVLGLGFSARADTADEIKAQIRARENARENHDFKMADEIRENLRENGVLVEDTSTGPKWRKTT